MSAFDNLTLAEVEDIQNICLNGRPMSDSEVDPMMVAGGVLWATERRNAPELSWQDFKAQTTMARIKQFSNEIESEEKADSPLVSPNGTRS